MNSIVNNLLFKTHSLSNNAVHTSFLYVFLNYINAFGTSVKIFLFFQISNLSQKGLAFGRIADEFAHLCIKHMLYLALVPIEIRVISKRKLIFSADNVVLFRE
jgi:hypothetical protein